MPLVVWRQPPKHNIWWCYRRVLPHMLWFGCIWPLLQNLPHERRTAHARATLRGAPGTLLVGAGEGFVTATSRRVLQRG